MENNPCPFNINPSGIITFGLSYGKACDFAEKNLQRKNFACWSPPKTQVRKKHLYKCPDCDQVFPWKRNLRRHKKLHLGQDPVVCEVCNKRFAVERCLHQHMAKHLAERFSCNICEDTFTNCDLLREHLVFHIRNEEI